MNREEAMEVKKWLDFEEERPCPLCGCGEWLLLSTKMQFSLDCRTVICSRCGFCFVSPLPRKDVLEAFYRDAYSVFYRKIHSNATAGAGSSSPENRARLAALEKHRPLEGASLLEIGPGKNGFVLAALERGMSCAVIEPSREFREFLSSRGVAVLTDFLENAPEGRKFDVVALFQVLEHFRDPGRALEIIRGLLKEDGIVILDVPDIRRPFRSLDRYYLRYVHLSYFSEKSLAGLLVRKGFRIRHIEATGGSSPVVPKNILAVASPDGRTVSVGIPVEDASELLSRLKRYRLLYPFREWPSFHVILGAGRLRKTLSGGFAGKTYRRIRDYFRGAGRASGNGNG